MGGPRPLGKAGRRGLKKNGALSVNTNARSRCTVGANRHKGALERGKVNCGTAHGDGRATPRSSQTLRRVSAKHV